MAYRHLGASPYEMGAKRANSSSGSRVSGKGRNSTSAPMELTSEEEALFVAISFGKVHKIASLIEKVDDVNIRIAQRMTPLLHTCSITRGELCSHVTRLLLKHRTCDVNAQESSGKTPLMLACMNKENTDVVRILVRHKNCDVNVTDTEGFTALMHAVSNDHTEAVRVLLLNSKSRQSLDVNVKNLSGATATDLAVKFKNKDVCKLLVHDGKADVTDLHEPSRLKSTLEKT